MDLVCHRMNKVYWRLRRSRQEQRIWQNLYVILLISLAVVLVHQYFFKTFFFRFITYMSKMFRDLTVVQWSCGLKRLLTDHSAIVPSPLRFNTKLDRSWYQKIFSQFLLKVGVFSDHHPKKDHLSINKIILNRRKTPLLH